jgi:hypothetical protein
MTKVVPADCLISLLGSLSLKFFSMTIQVIEAGILVFKTHFFPSRRTISLEVRR